MALAEHSVREYIGDAMEPLAAVTSPSGNPLELVGPLRARMESLAAENHRLTLRVKMLEAALQARAAVRESLDADPAALSLFRDETDPGGGTPPPATPAARGTARSVRAPKPPLSVPRPQSLDPNLPRDVIRLPDPPASTRRCSGTGVPLVPGFTQTLEVLARKPAVYFVKRYERTVWVSPAKTAPVATPWAADVLTRARVHASVVAHIAASHFSEHVPYYRLEQQLARTGVHLPRSSQVALMAQLDALVLPLVDSIKASVLQSGYVHLDATPVDVCDPARPGEARSATLWTYRARSRDPAIDGLVWYDYQPTKSPAAPRAVVQEAKYRGIIQTDGASGLDALGVPEQVTHLGCWAHARRYLVEAVTLGERHAARYLTQVDRLFRIDARAQAVLRCAPAERRRAIEARAATWRARFSVPLAAGLL